MSRMSQRHEAVTNRSSPIAHRCILRPPVAARAGAQPQRERLGGGRVRSSAPIFFFLMFVIAETALVFIAEQVMDNAVFETARLVRTGQAQTANMTKERVQDERLRPHVGIHQLRRPNPNFYLDVKSYASFGDMDLGKPIDDDDTFKAEGDI